MYVVILAGASGTRQRPLTGGERPVMFERDGDGPTVLERTLSRVANLVDPLDIVVVSDRRHGQAVRETSGRDAIGRERCPEAVVARRLINPRR